jgi:hypothetical protein
VHDRLRRGEDPGFEFGGLTEAERDAFMALVRQRIAHGEEVLEAVEANVRALKALLVLVVSSAPSGSRTLGEALQAGHISIQDVVDAIPGAEPDPLA